MHGADDGPALDVVEVESAYELTLQHLTGSFEAEAEEQRLRDHILWLITHEDLPNPLVLESSEHLD